jgi:hypothetical protein
MNVNVLIDAIVRQTTVLIAQLATAAGARASLSQTANQVFSNLVAELKHQGLGNKLIAEMFGVSLRTYHNKVRRLAESSTERGQSLWDAVLAFVQQQGTVSRGAVLIHFSRDDHATVKSVLADLVGTGMVFAKGSNDNVVYRAASPAEYDLGDADEQGQALANLVWIAVARHSPIARSDLAELVPMTEAQLDQALDRLVRDQRVGVESGGAQPKYRSPACVIAVGEPAGWEASVFDHYQAMVIAICAKLRRGGKRSQHGEAIGGSTYGYDVWRGHPLHDEVLGFLEATRARARELRARVDQHNAGSSCAEEQRRYVVFYVGQAVIEGDESLEEARS